MIGASPLSSITACMHWDPTRLGQGSALSLLKVPETRDYSDNRKIFFAVDSRQRGGATGGGRKGGWGREGGRGKATHWFCRLEVIRLHHYFATIQTTAVFSAFHTLGIQEQKQAGIYSLGLFPVYDMPRHTKFTLHEFMVAVRSPLCSRERQKTDK